MRTFSIIFALLFFLSTAHGQSSPFIWGSGTAKNLTDSITYKNNVTLNSGSVDPTVTATPGSPGSIYISTSGTAYIKQDSGSSTNWLPFSASAGGGGITAINAQSGPTVTIQAGTSGTDFAVSSSANTITLNLPTASATNRGALSSANWSTFNNKEPAISSGSSSEVWQGDKTWVAKTSLPISTATQTALDLKADLASPTFTGTVSGITKAMVGLGNVDNTSDANKPVSTATQTALDLKEDLSNKSTSTSLGTSNSLYPTQNAVKSYVDTGLATKEGTITTLPLSKGGTNKNMTAVAGGVVVTDSDSQEVTAAGTSGQILESAGSGTPVWADKSISGKAQDIAAVTVKEMQVPNSLLTPTASGKYLNETGNNNILVNPSFENSSVVSGWSYSVGSSAADLSVRVQGQQAAKLTLSSQTLSITQDVARYADQFADGVQGVAWVRVKTSLSGISVCPRNAGANLSTCATVIPDNKWMLYKVPFVLGATSNGISIASSGAVTGDVYIDDAYLGTDAGIADVSIVTPWQSYTPTGSWSANTTYVGKWRQVGTDIEIDVKVAVTGAPTSASLTVNIPSQFTINTSILSDSTAAVGSIENTVHIRDAGTDQFTGTVKYNSSTSIAIFKDDGDGSVSAVTQAAPMTWASGDFLTIKASIPVNELSGSTQVFASQCGANCENVLSAFISSTTPSVISQSGSWVTSVAKSGTSNQVKTLTVPSGVFTSLPTCTCTVPATPSTADRSCAFDTTNSTTTSLIFSTAVNGTAAENSMEIICQKNGADYQSSRTIIGSFKEVVTAPGITKPKTCMIQNGGSGSSSSPTVCGASPCTEYQDNCGTASACTRSATGQYSCAWGDGTWSNSTPLYCWASSRSASAGTLPRLFSPYAATSTGGATVLPNLVIGTTDTDSMVTVYCLGNAP